MVGVWAQCDKDQIVLQNPIPSFDCAKCKYVVQDSDEIIDGAALHIRPGDYICLPAKSRNNSPLLFVNIKGQPGNPVVITNCGGEMTRQVDANAPFNIKFRMSSNF